eukprot:TRINITY_DN3410_c0_g1_i7.p1 TRINITY_DN3410_c0_g1~~TRINITY_DN3410_c0_g1_i7.p1  ORF type:complete len:465 (+),score=50.52 TRINITY_DN3410_c0_g1_i7:60-1454(+)
MRPDPLSQVVQVTPMEGAKSGDEEWATPRASLTIQSRRRKVLFYMAMVRTQRFGMVSFIVFTLSLLWAGVRYYLMVNGENQVSQQAFEKLAISIKNTIRMRVQQDLVYQDMIAGIWITNPKLSRSDFRKLVLSEPYKPGLQAMTGISLIPRVIGAADRIALENDLASEQLRKDCCTGTSNTGSKCTSVAASGLFCGAGAYAGASPQRYQFTQFGANGVLVPAVGNSSKYIERVGQEEYMVVDVIEPFASNSKVWGFNLLSSDTRLAAWRSAMATGMKTFTRRLNLVQSTSKEYGFLVWLPVFTRADGEWVTALDGNTNGLTAVGSVNGVYRAQRLLTAAIESTYSEEQLDDIRVFLFDNAEELNGKAQFLAAYWKGAQDTYTIFGQSSAESVTAKNSVVVHVDLKVESADVRWLVIVESTTDYLSKRRTNNPMIGLTITLVVVLASTIDRWIGHPKLVVRSMQT